MLSGAGEGDEVFAYLRSQCQRRWEATREAAGLEHVRFKDLRAVFATAYLKAGGSPKNLMHILGHSNLQTTLRYIRQLPIEAGEDMTAAEEELGLSHHLRAEGRDA